MEDEMQARRGGEETNGIKRKKHKRGQGKKSQKNTCIKIKAEKKEANGR